jgi:hypothetical protein
MPWKEMIIVCSVINESLDRFLIQPQAFSALGLRSSSQVAPQSMREWFRFAAFHHFCIRVCFNSTDFSSVSNQGPTLLVARDHDTIQLMSLQAFHHRLIRSNHNPTAKSIVLLLLIILVRMLLSL